MKKLLSFLILLSLLCWSCTNSGIEGNGIYVEKQYPISGFSKVEVKHSFEVIITQADEFNVRVSAEENILPTISVQKSGDVLEIKYRSDLILKPRAKVKVYVSAPEYKALDISGASKLYSNGLLAGSKLLVEASGASKVKLEVIMQQLTADGSGASDFEFVGKVKVFAAEASGSTDINAKLLEAQDVQLDLSGASKADVVARQKLSVDASGASRVRYAGNPQISSDLSGAAKLKQVQ